MKKITARIDEEALVGAAMRRMLRGGGLFVTAEFGFRGMAFADEDDVPCYSVSCEADDERVARLVAELEKRYGRGEGYVFVEKI